LKPYTELPSGEPHVRFAGGDQPGWYTRGRRAFVRPTADKGFWSGLFFALAQQNLDTAHTLGSVPCAGAIGFSGTSLVSLLGLALAKDAIIFNKLMGPALASSGLYLADVAGDWKLLNPQGEELPVSKLMGTKKSARIWTGRLCQLLQNESFDEVQVSHLQCEAERGLTNDCRARIGWPRSGARDFWQFSEEQRKLFRIFAGIAAIHGPVVAEMRAFTHVNVEPRDADAALRSLQSDKTVGWLVGRV
jgi:hypothetical protein